MGVTNDPSSSAEWSVLAYIAGTTRMSLGPARSPKQGKQVGSRLSVHSSSSRHPVDGRSTHSLGGPEGALVAEQTPCVRPHRFLHPDELSPLWLCANLNQRNKRA